MTLPSSRESLICEYCVHYVNLDLALRRDWLNRRVRSFARRYRLKHLG